MKSRQKITDDSDMANESNDSSIARGGRNEVVTGEKDATEGGGATAGGNASRGELDTGSNNDHRSEDENSNQSVNRSKDEEEIVDGSEGAESQQQVNKRKKNLAFTTEWYVRKDF